MKKMTKSPLKANPLRNPGQSLDERIQDVIYDEIFEKAIYLIVIFVLALQPSYTQMDTQLKPETLEAFY